jgi:hypothetical protein
VISLLLIYLIVGFIHMFLISAVTRRITKLGGDVEYEHGERIMTILVWPVFAFFFWYNFIRTLLGMK